MEPQNTRSVVYKKESSVPQRVMWMSTSVGTATCPFANWLVQRADDNDYVNAGLNYFELKGSLAYVRLESAFFFRVNEVCSRQQTRILLAPFQCNS